MLHEQYGLHIIRSAPVTTKENFNHIQYLYVFKIFEVLKLQVYRDRSSISGYFLNKMEKRVTNTTSSINSTVILVL